MPLEDKLALPFLTRKMLAFEHATKFQLRIHSQSNEANAIEVRGVTSEGVFAFKHTPNSDFTSKTEVFDIPDIPIFVSVLDTGRNFDQGQLYVRLSLVINGDIALELASGLIFDAKGISWPATNVRELFPNRGLFRRLSGTDPTAGNEVSTAVPDGVIWRLLSMNVTMTAAAAAATRRVHFTVRRNSRDLYHFISSQDHIISETWNYNLSAFGGAGDFSNGDDIIIPIPADMILVAGDTITTETENINAGDDFNAPSYYVEQFYETA